LGHIVRCLRNIHNAVQVGVLSPLMTVTVII